MTNLRSQVRKTIEALDRIGDIDNSIPPMLDEIRAMLKAKNLGPNCRVGEKMEDGSEECVEWYAGQLLAIIDTQQLFAMNSLINCLDRFCPSDNFT